MFIFRSVLCMLCLSVYLVGKKCKKISLIWLIPPLYVIEVCLIVWEASLKLDQDKDNYEAILEHTVFMRLAFVYFFQSLCLAPTYGFVIYCYFPVGVLAMFFAADFSGMIGALTALQIIDIQCITYSPYGIVFFYML